MLIRPRIRGFICTTAHPRGCYEAVLRQVKTVDQKGPLPKQAATFKKVLVIGSSMGYGLSSRIVTAFGGGAATLGVCYEKPADKGRTASAGWYHTAAFHSLARENNLYAKTINGDAFSNEVREETIKCLREDMGEVDLVIYSVAAPKRVDPFDKNLVYHSTLKPIGSVFKSKTVNTMTEVVDMMSVTPASHEEIKDTIKVMGGDDWILWIQALLEAKVLSQGALTLAYSYLGPDLTYPIYRHGTIGKAKEDLEKSAKTIHELLAPLEGQAVISINKALVTQASSAIPVLPLYIALLYRVMKDRNVHEGCIEQMYRLFSQKILNRPSKEKALIEVLRDKETGYIRLDDYEMNRDVQSTVQSLWEKVHTSNVKTLSDLEGYRQDFLNLYGFGYANVDYDEDVESHLPWD